MRGFYGRQVAAPRRRRSGGSGCSCCSTSAASEAPAEELARTLDFLGVSPWTDRTNAS